MSFPQNGIFKNAAAIYNAVAEFSNNKDPNYVDFYSYALHSKDEKLVQAILMIPESDFLVWKKIVTHLDHKYFDKKPISKELAENARNLRPKSAATHSERNSIKTPKVSQSFERVN